MSFMAVDYTFFDTYRFPLLRAGNFDATDHNFDWNAITNVIMNVNAIKLLGIKIHGKQ